MKKNFVLYENGVEFYLFEEQAANCATGHRVQIFQSLQISHRQLFRRQIIKDLSPKKTGFF